MFLQKQIKRFVHQALPLQFSPTHFLFFQRRTALIYSLVCHILPLKLHPRSCLGYSERSFINIFIPLDHQYIYDILTHHSHLQSSNQIILPTSFMTGTELSTIPTTQSGRSHISWYHLGLQQAQILLNQSKKKKRKKNYSRIVIKKFNADNTVFDISENSIQAHLVLLYFALLRFKDVAFFTD